MADGFDPELKKKLLEIEARKPANKQVRLLEDLAQISQELLGVIDDAKGDTKNFRKDLAPILLDMRASLEAIRGKETPEMPDYAEPVVKAVGQLEKKLTKAIVKSASQREIKVDAPQVNIEPPRVDLGGVEKLLKERLPSAFESAIKAIPRTEIPEVDFTPLMEQFSAIQEILESIDTASRMKPEAPKSMQVTTANGTAVETVTTKYDFFVKDHSSDPNISYLGLAAPGSATSSAVWQIQEVDQTSGKEFRYADGDANFDNVWDDRESLSY